MSSPFTLLATAFFDGAVNGGTTGTIDTTGATLLVASTHYYVLGVPTLTDSKGNTWVALTERQDVLPDNCTKLFYCINPIVGSGHTFSVNGTATYSSVKVLAFSSPSMPIYNSQNGSNAAAGLTIQTGKVTTSWSNNLFIAACTVYDNPSPLTIDSGFTLDSFHPFNPGGGWYGGAIAHKVSSIDNSEQPTFTGATTSWYSTATANFYCETGGVGSGYLVQPIVVDYASYPMIVTMYGITAGSTIIVQYSGTIDTGTGIDAAGSSTVTGSIVGLYNWINKSRDGYGNSVNQYYYYNHPGGDETFTPSGINANAVLAIFEVGGLDNTSSPLMVSAGAIGTSPLTDSLTFADDAFITEFYYNQTTNDFTSLVGVDTIANHTTGANYNLQAYKRRVAAGTLSVGMNVGGATNNVMVCAAWRVAPTGSYFNPIGPPLFLNRGTYPGTGSFASINLGAGESVIIASNANWSQDVTAISDGGSNSLTKIAGGTLNNSRTLSFWLLENAVANASCVFSLTYSGASAFSFAYLQRFSGAIVLPFDAWAEGNVAGNVTVTTNLRTLTTTKADTVLFSLVTDEDPGDAGQKPPTRFNHLISDTGIIPPTDPPVGSFDYKILSSTVSAQTISATGTNSSYSKRILVVALELAVGTNLSIIKSIIGVQSLKGIQSITF